MNKENTLNASSRGTPWRVAGWSLVAVLLLLPAVAMLFTDEVNWTVGDFIFAAVLLVGTGLVLEAVVRLSPDRLYRAGVAVAALTGLLLVWINGAVGIIGNEDNPANLLYFAVLVAAAVGAVVGRFRAPCMARAMAIAAAVQLLIAIASPTLGWGPPGVHALRTFFLNGAFVLLWGLAAGLFFSAGRTRGPQ